jgi:hypothetical protein
MKKCILLTLSILLFFGSFPAISDASIVSRWKLNESGTNDRLDDTGSNDFSSCTNTTLVNGHTGTNNATQFDGNGASASLSDASASGIEPNGTTAFSMGFRAKATATGVWHFAWGHGDQFDFYASSTNDTMLFQWDNGSLQSLSFGTAMDTSTWRHYVVTYDGSTVRLYLDGNATPVASQAETTGFAASSDVFLFGTTGATDWSNIVMSDAFYANHCMTTTEIATYYGYSEDFAPGETVTLTEYDDLRVFQRDGTSADIPISGTYAGGTPTGIQYRITDTGGTYISGHDWQTLDSSPSGGTFSGTASSVPQGGWYNIDVRWTNDTGIVDNGENDIGVGIIVGTIGQSNMYMWFSASESMTITPNSLVSVYDDVSEAWYAPHTDYLAYGGAEFADTLADELSIPIGLVDVSKVDRSLRWEASGAYAESFWDERTDVAGILLTAFTDVIDDIGGEIEVILWYQGERDSYNGIVTEAEYEDSFGKMKTSCETTLSNTDVKWYIFPLSRCTSGTPCTSYVTDASWQAIKDAIYDIAAGDSDIRIAADPTTRANSDGIHVTNAEHGVLGELTAQTFLYDLGEVTYTGSGAYIDSYEIVDTTTIDLRIEHDGGTDFTAADSAWDGFGVNGSGVSVTGAARQSATVIRLTVSGDTANVTGVYYQYGEAPAVTDPVYDNSALTIPLQSISDIPEYEPDIVDPVCTITTPSGATVSWGLYVSGSTLYGTGHDSTPTISGTASDAVGVTSVTWACPESSPTSGTATGTTSWSITDITLAEGENVITVTAHDAATNTGQDVTTITFRSEYGYSLASGWGVNDVIRQRYKITSRDTSGNHLLLGGCAPDIPLVNQTGFFYVDFEIDAVDDCYSGSGSSNCGPHFILNPSWDGEIYEPAVNAKRIQDN